jgi:hypothetical protein
MPGGETIGDIDSVFFALLTLSVMVLSAALHALQIEGYGPGAVERVGLGALTVLPSENPRRAAFSVLCFSISAASSSSLIRPRRALGPAELLLLIEALDQPPTPFLPDEFLRVAHAEPPLWASGRRPPSLQDIMAHRHPWGANFGEYVF